MPSHFLLKSIIYMFFIFISLSQIQYVMFDFKEFPGLSSHTYKMKYHRDS